MSKKIMRLLSRKSGEVARIGSDTRVRVLGVSGDQAHLSIEAPTDAPIVREESHLSVIEENQRAVLKNAEQLQAAADLVAPRRVSLIDARRRILH